MSRQWEQRLEGLKLAAQAQEDREQALAQVDIGAHLLEVCGKGQGRFAFLLSDNCFRIALSRSDAQALPLAYGQISSEMLTAIGADKAQERLRFIVNTFGKAVEDASVSRVDLFVDFLCETPMDSWPATAWVTRAHRIDAYHVQRRFSGWAIGLGGNMGARLYDKTLELEKSHKDYLKPLWQAKGWQEGQTVWRLEFEFKRPVLKELSVLDLPNLQANLAGLWRYATKDRLRLAVPTPSDSSQTRWPTHPLWLALSSLDWDQPDAPVLSRFRKERLPHDEALFVNGLGAITSFMAREGITDLGEGFGEFLDEITRDLVEEIARIRKADGVTNITVNHTIQVIRVILRRAEREWGWLDKAPALRFRPVPKRRIRWLTREEADRLLETLPEHLAEMVRFTLATGLREANVTGLEWSQVDLTRRVAWIHPDQAKARKAIPVPLNAEAVLVLRRQMGKHPARLFVYTRHTWVFGFSGA